MSQLVPYSVGAPVGFVQLFPGWNVWDVWQSQDPIDGLGGAIMNAGLSLERQLRIWVEKAVEEGAPAAALADPLNPAALRGDQVQILPNSGDLVALQTRGDVPGLAGALQLGEQGSQTVKRTVRFYNRGDGGALPWPHDENYLVDRVYEPSTTNPLTTGPAPDSLAGAADAALGTAGTVLKVVAIGAGAVLVVGLVALLAKSSRREAA